MLVDDLIFRRASGVRVGKAQYLEELAKPENTYARLELKQIETLIHGNDVALVSLRVEAKGQRGPKQLEGNFRNTRLFVKRAGEWQCVSWFSTPE